MKGNYQDAEDMKSDSIRISRTKSNPEYFPVDPIEYPPVRPHSMFSHRHSPPPGHHPEFPVELPASISRHEELSNGGGVFIPESNVDDVIPLGHHRTSQFHPMGSRFEGKPSEGMFHYEDSLSHRKEQLHRSHMNESFDSLIGSSPPISLGHVSLNSEDHPAVR